MDSEWNLIPNTIWPLPTRYFSVFLAKFTMRFISFVIAGTAVTFFNTYAYAKPAKSPVSNLDNAGLRQADWCEGFSDLTCSIRCSAMGYTDHTCTAEYVQVQMSSYKFDT